MDGNQTRLMPNFELEDHFTPALIEEFAKSRRGEPDLAKAVNYAMQLLVSFAMDKCKPADRAAIKARLERPLTNAKFEIGITKRGKSGKESGAKRYKVLKGSVGEMIVWKTNYKGARSFRNDPAKWFATVGRFIGARVGSAGYLKFGFNEALSTFKINRGKAGRMPRYKHPAGTAKGALPVELVPEAQVVNFARGIAEKYPQALEQAAPEAARALAEYTLRNLNDRAAKKGLATR